MNDINLMPAVKKPKASVLRISKILKKVSNIAVVVFFSVAVVVAAAYFFFTNRVDAAKDKYEETKRQVEALEQTEQRYFLLQDRLKKIENVRALMNASEEVEILKEVLGYLQEEIIFTEAVLDQKEAKLSVYIKNSFDLSKLIDDMKNNDTFNFIEMSSLEFQPVLGYEAVFVIRK